MDVVLKLLAFESLLLKNEWSIKQASKGAKADGGIQQMKTLTYQEFSFPVYPKPKPIISLFLMS